jgi:transposase-like protein
LSGQSVAAVARAFHLNHKTVIEWRNAAGLGSTHVEPEKKALIGDLTVANLRETLTTLRLQAEQFRDPDWLRRQSAEGAAVLYGVMSDKAFRLLEALDAGGGIPTDEPPDDA